MENQDTKNPPGDSPKAPNPKSKLVLSLVGTVIIFTIFCFWTLNSIFEEATLNSSPETPVDAIICLAGGKGRIKTAFDLFMAQKGHYLFVSGTGPKYDLDNVKYVTSGIFELSKENLTHIEIDPISRSTIENAYNALRFSQKRNAKSILLITSDYHMKRAHLIFQKIFPPEIEIKTMVSPSQNLTASNWWRSWVGIKIVFFEWLKWIRTKWFFIGSAE